MDEDEGFLRAVYEQHGAVLLRFGARLLAGDLHRAEDVVQEAVIRAWKHAAELDPTTGAIRSWLFAVIRNLVIDGDRARRTRPPEVPGLDVALPPTPDGVDQVLTAQVVVEAMASLSRVHREVLLHLHFMGRSVPQTAKAVGIPGGTVKSRAHYAMRALRRALEERGVLAA
ncbi:sigma-70 family RNA polymerase sigma factor [Streptomyces sp. NPDC007100]|uniref:sigma-70 family RNA polymerase sigma factor n=1 Tax=Streptomyces sp. NPDC007100 TaxID=3155602 RepID=UPI0033DD7527